MNGLDLLTGTTAGAAGMVSANVRRVGDLLHADMGKLQATMQSGFSTLVREGRKNTDSIISNATANKTEIVGTLGQGFSNLQALSVLNTAVSAVGFAVLSRQLSGLTKEARATTEATRAIARAQEIMISGQNRLVDLAEKSLSVQEQILETLRKSRTNDALQLVRQGLQLLGAGFADDALQRFRRSLDADATIFVTHLQIAGILERRGDQDGALDHMVRATLFSGDQEPRHRAGAFSGLAEIYLSRGAVDAAEASLRSAVEADPLPGYLLRHAQVLVRAGKSTEALTAVQRAVAADRHAFVCALGDPELGALQPALTEALAAVDARERQVIVDQLEQVLNLAAVLRELGEAADDCLDLARETYEAALVGTYLDLALLRKDAEELRDVLRKRIAEACGLNLRVVRERHDQTARLLGARPEAVPGDVGGKTAALAAGTVAAAAVGAMTVVGLVPAAILAHKTYKARQDEKKMAAEALHEWERSVRQALDGFRLMSSPIVTTLRRAATLPGAEPQVRAVLAEVERLVSSPELRSLYGSAAG